MNSTARRGVRQRFVESLEANQRTGQFEVSTSKAGVRLDRQEIRLRCLVVSLSQLKRVPHVEVSQSLSRVQCEGFLICLSRCSLVATVREGDAQIDPGQRLLWVDREASADCGDRLCELARSTMHLTHRVQDASVAGTQLERLVVGDRTRFEVAFVPCLVTQEP